MIEYTKEGSGTPVVFLHGFLGNRQNLKNLAGSLDPHRYASYLIDMPSHGQSSYLPALTYPKLTQALNDFFEKEGIAQAILVGHSMGGKTAISFALQYPKKVLGLMTLDASMSSQIHKQKQIIETIERFDLSCTLKEARNYLEEQLEDDRALVSFILLNLKSTPNGFFWTKDLVKLLKENVGIWEPAEIPKPCYPFEKPLVSVRGDSSSFSPLEDHGKMVAYFPNTQFVTLEKVGHFPHLENPSLCASLLKDLAERSEIFPLHLHFL